MMVSRLRVFFAHGTGDVCGSFRFWQEEKNDPRILARAYSTQFFELMRKIDAEALVAAIHPSSQQMRYGDIAIEPVASSDVGSGFGFYADKWRQGRTLAAMAQRFRADVALVHSHHGLVSAGAFARHRIPVVMTMHNTLWPMGTAPSPRRRLVGILETPSTRLGVKAAVVVSPECGRQVQSLHPKCAIFGHVPQYAPELATLRDGPKQRGGTPFRLLFAGRIEPNKGVFDLVEAAAQLQRRSPGKVRWIIAGTGSADARLRRMIDEEGLASEMELTGYLGQPELLELMGTVDATITPTQTGFNEGLAKAPLESLIFGIPAITSSVVPAREVVGDAAIVVPPGSPAAIAEAAWRLVTEPDHYASSAAASSAAKSRLFDSRLSYGNAVSEALHFAVGRVAEP